MLIHKILKINVLALAGLIILFFAYSIAVIFHAHYQTRGVIDDLTSAEFMRLDLDDLSPDWLNILLAVEDPNFFNHSGYDLSTPGAGWTTITQALVKLYYFEHFKPGFAKIRQTLIAAYVFDPVVSKENQLRLFLNRAYLGHIDEQPVIGFDRASRVYFAKEFTALEREEYMALVAMLIAPNSVNVIKQPEANAERVRRIINLVDNKKAPLSWGDIWLEGCE